MLRARRAVVGARAQRGEVGCDLDDAVGAARRAEARVDAGDAGLAVEQQRADVRAAGRLEVRARFLSVVQRLDPDVRHVVVARSP